MNPIEERNFSTLPDRLLAAVSLAGPVVCLVHCLALPVVIGLLPVLGHNGAVFGLSEQALALLVIPLCLVGIMPGYLQHRRASVLVLLLAGVTLVLTAAFETGVLFPSTIELPVCLSGCSLLIAAGILNFKLLSCRHDCTLHAEEVVQEVAGD